MKIALSNLVSKVLDDIILMREKDELLTKDLQFGVKAGTSCTMFTAVVKKICFSMFLMVQLFKGLLKMQRRLSIEIIIVNYLVY